MRALSGFTLIELLVAMAITAIVSMLAYTGLDNAVRLAEAAELEAERLQKINRVFDIISKDFRQVIARPVRDADGNALEPAFALDLAKQPMLQFTRAGWINPAPARFQRSELQRVNYHFDGNKLTRYHWPMLDRYPDSNPQEVVLFENVRSFEIRVMTDVGTTNAMGQVVAAEKGEWVEAWPINNPLSPTNAMIDLPIAIEIAIEIDGWGKIRRIYELVSEPVIQ